mmetsp:Transcript_8977/g.10405  ORF Transcript_8977/g.10405 Transcript_8977/m.10405 type:complete len:153 (+) Transcript_8977:171-629(+)
MMQPTNSNDSESQEWKKKKGVIPTLIAAAFGILVVVFFFANNSRLPNTSMTETSASVLRGFEAADVKMLSFLFDTSDGTSFCTLSLFNSVRTCLLNNCNTLINECEEWIPENLCVKKVCNCLITNCVGQAVYDFFWESGRTSFVWFVKVKIR